MQPVPDTVRMETDPSSQTCAVSLGRSTQTRLAISLGELKLRKPTGSEVKRFAMFLCVREYSLHGTY